MGAGRGRLDHIAWLRRDTRGLGSCRLLADENIPRRLIIYLREEGVDVVRLQDVAERGLADYELVSLANGEGRAILTRDRDFVENPRLARAAHMGIVYLAYQPDKRELRSLAGRLARLLTRGCPGLGRILVIRQERVDIVELGVQ